MDRQGKEDHEDVHDRAQKGHAGITRDVGNVHTECPLRRICDGNTVSLLAILVVDPLSLLTVSNYAQPGPVPDVR